MHTKNHKASPAPGSHAHVHSHHSTGNIGFVFFINLFFTVLEIVGGLWTNSAAILADALHDLGDTVSLGFSFLLEKISGKKRDQNFTYGYRRFSLLSACINGFILLGGSFLVLMMALPRLLAPQAVYAPGMVGLAGVGILFNGLAVWRLRKGHTMNEKVLTWHLIEDVFGWLTILFTGLFLLFYDLPILDPLLSIFFSLITLWNVFRLFKQTAMLFLQSVPGSIEVEQVEGKICEVLGVHSVHDTHIWSMDGEYNVLTTHVVLQADVSNARILEVKRNVHSVLREFPIQHCTVEMENIDETCRLKDC